MIIDYVTYEPEIEQVEAKSEQEILFNMSYRVIYLGLSRRNCKCNLSQILKFLFEK